MESRTTVTISRKMGSGGAYVGKSVAGRLGLTYIDREVLRYAATSLGIDEAEAEAARERVPSLFERLFGGLSFGAVESRYTPPPVQRFTDEDLFAKQVEAMELIARERDCVIVGYGAAHVLPCHERMVNLYFHAPFETRVRRVADIYGVGDRAKARRMVEESDASRKAYFVKMTGKDWACADNYHLCVDTSLFEFDELADRVVAFVERKLRATGSADDCP